MPGTDQTVLISVGIFFIAQWIFIYLIVSHIHDILFHITDNRDPLNDRKV